MRAANRAVGALSRRLGRPEMLAAIDADARQAQREALAIGAVLAATLRGQGTYVDVGTNRGQVLREAVRIAPRARHIAFEPIPALAQEIGREFPNVDCRNKAIGARSETAEFCYFHELHGWSGLRRNPEISDARGRPEFITVEVSTLDAELDGVTPSVVKIDVEGAEVAAIEGGRSLLARARPLVIFEHVYAAAALYGAVPGAPWDLLSELAYEIFAITGEGPFARSEFVAGAGTSGGAGIVNWLATPSAGPAPA